MNAVSHPRTIDIDGPGGQQARAPEQLGLRQLLRMLHRNATLFTVLVLGAGSLGAYVVLTRPQTYAAVGSIMVAPSEPTAFADTALTAAPSEAISVNSEIQVLYSPALAARVVGQTGYADAAPRQEPGLVAGALAAVKAVVKDALRPSPVMAGPAAGLSPVVERFLGVLEVTPVDRSRAVRVRFTDTDPGLAARVVDSLMQSYLAQQLENRVSAIQGTSLWLRQRLEELQAEVRRKEEELATFKAERSTVEGRDLNLLNSQIAELNRELAQAQAASATAAAQQRAAEQAVRREGPRAVFSLAGSTLVDTLRAQESNLRTQEADLAAQYGPGHPRLREVRSQLAAVSADIDAEARNLGAQARNAARMAVERVRALEATRKQLQDEVLAIGTASAEQQALERNAEASRLVLQRFLERNEEVEQSRTEQSGAWVIHNAFVSGDPEGPPTGILLGGVAAGALALGMFGVGLREVVRRGITGHDDVEALVGHPCFGLVPQVRAGAFATPRGPQDLLLDDLHSPYAEALKHILVSVDLACPRRRASRAVMVSSALPGEGKSTLVASLGRLSAIVGERVLVIDCDLRRPTLGTIFGSRGGPGLAAYLEGTAELDEAVEHDTRSGLHYLPAGEPTVRTETLLRSPRMSVLLEEAAKHYDMVLVDTPPVLAAPDARVLAGQVDVTVMVTRWLHTKPQVVRLAVERLERSGARAMGVVLSRVDFDRAAVYGGESMEYLTSVRYYAQARHRTPAPPLPPAPGSRHDA